MMIRKREIKCQDTLARLQELQARILSGQMGTDHNTLAVNVANELCKSYIIQALDKWVTQDSAMIAMKAKVHILADRKDPVLITGPSGTGKELIARALRIPGQPFVAVNCGGILNKELAPALFFGHKKGTFTGAIEDKKGYLVEAEDGIIFLDEIGDLSQDLQAMLLRAMQESEIYPVGSVEPIDISCRFVAATKKNLRSMVEEGTFREDLFARIYTFELRITPLTERPADIELIAQHLRHGQPLVEPFPQAVMDDIKRFNVRAIQTAIKRYELYGSYD